MKKIYMLIVENSGTIYGQNLILKKLFNLWNIFREKEQDILISILNKKNLKNSRTKTTYIYAMMKK